MTDTTNTTENKPNVPQRLLGYVITDYTADSRVLKVWIDPNQDDLQEGSVLTVEYQFEAGQRGFWDQTEKGAQEMAHEIVRDVNRAVCQNGLPEIKRLLEEKLSYVNDLEVKVLWQRKFSQLDVATLMYIWAMKKKAERAENRPV